MGLIQEFQQADAERRREVKQLQDEVTTMLKEFNEAHRVMGSELRNSLTKSVTKRRSDVATMVREFTAQAQGRQAEVAAIAQEATAIVEAADTFVKDLVKGSVQRRSEVAAMLKDFAQGDTERRSSVTEYMHAEVGKIRSEVANMFKDLAKGDTEHRSEVAAIHEMVWGKAPTRKRVAPVVKELPREVAIETAPTGELRDKVFTYLANHPDGTRLTELEEAFGVARIQTARVVRELMNGNKVEKHDLLYFAI